MTTLSKDELRKITEADDLYISPFRKDGVTYGTSTWIWSVAVDDARSRGTLKTLLTISGNALVYRREIAVSLPSPS